MKYKILLKFLHGMVLVKRFFWAVGSHFFGFLSAVILSFWKVFGYFAYKTKSFLKKLGLRKESLWFLRRDNLQIILFIALFIICLPQTAILSKEEEFLPGQKSLAYKLFGPGEQYKDSFEEIYPETSAVSEAQTPPWRVSMVSKQLVSFSNTTENVLDNNLATILNDSSLRKPLVLPGNINIGIRKNIIDYIIGEGDSLGGIAYGFGISVETLLWENGLVLRSVIKPGQVLKVLPVTGISHTIKKGDTLKKIVSTYKGSLEDIIFFNGLDEDGSNLKIGEKIIIPNGIKQNTQVKVVSRPNTVGSVISGVKPANSAQSPSTKGFVWPSAAKTITQYYSWSHHGLDVAGPKNSANYAAKAGTVEVSQCGWNSGYGCYVIINHGGGVKTLYGHHNTLLVSAGDYVEAGQTIGLMGNTGKVYGVTGIHLHFEVIINGVKKNPLLYVR